MVYLKRSGGQEQYSAPLQFQSQAENRLADVAAWIANNLSENLGLERLAERANVCPRHFTRLFRQSFGTSPADFIEKLRLGEARRLLGERGSRVEHVASTVGFASTDAFRRAFERRLGLTPSQYRGRFQPNGRRRSRLATRVTRSRFRPSGRTADPVFVNARLRDDLSKPLDSGLGSRVYSGKVQRDQDHADRVGRKAHSAHC